MQRQAPLVHRNSRSSCNKKQLSSNDAVLDHQLQHLQSVEHQPRLEHRRRRCFSTYRRHLSNPELLPPPPLERPPPPLERPPLLPLLEHLLLLPPPCLTPPLEQTLTPPPLPTPLTPGGRHRVRLQILDP
ncbi:hypothetical protein ACUV84_008144 [Puccinellia chinampoensis]